MIPSQNHCWKLSLYHCPGTPPELKPVNQGSLTIQGLHLSMQSFRKMSFFTDKKEIQKSATALGYVAHVSFGTSLSFFASDIFCLCFIFYLTHFQKSYDIVSKLLHTYCNMCIQKTGCPFVLLSDVLNFCILNCGSFYMLMWDCGPNNCWKML